MSAKYPSTDLILKRRPSYSSSDDDEDDETEVFIGPVTAKELYVRAEVLNRSSNSETSLNRTFEIDDPLVEAFDVSTSVEQGLDVNALDCCLLSDAELADTSPLSPSRQDEITQEALKIAARLKYGIPADYGSIPKEEPDCSKNHDEIVAALEKHPVANFSEVVMTAQCHKSLDNKRTSAMHNTPSEALRSATPSRIPVRKSALKSHLPVPSSRKRSMFPTESNKANESSPSKRRNIATNSMPQLRSSIIPPKAH